MKLKFDDKRAHEIGLRSNATAKLIGDVADWHRDQAIPRSGTYEHHARCTSAIRDAQVLLGTSVDALLEDRAEMLREIKLLNMALKYGSLAVQTEREGPYDCIPEPDAEAKKWLAAVHVEMEK
jgi:hypothetical protein